MKGPRTASLRIGSDPHGPARLPWPAGVLLTQALAASAARAPVRSAVPPTIDVAAEPTPLGERLLLHKEPEARFVQAVDPSRLLALPASAWCPATLAARSSSFPRATPRLSWPLAAWNAWTVDPHRPYQAARLALFSTFWLAMPLRTLIARGQIATDLHSLEDAAQRALLKQEQQENPRLAAAVEAKTREPPDAIDPAQASSREKSAFPSTASHEPRAPLHDIPGYAQLLARDVPAACADRLAAIQDSGKRLLYLINEMLDFSRGEAKPIVLEPAPLSLQRLAARLTEIHRPRAARGNSRLATRVDTAPVDWVLADEQRLVQILRNLLENACRYTRNGHVHLCIALARPRTGDTPAEGEAVLLRFAVSDTGMGIPAARHETVFQPFNRIHGGDATPGLGLGLAIARQLAGATGGRISVRSSQHAPSGSRFELGLALRRRPRQEDTEEQRFPVGYRGPQRTVLIADDASNSRRFLAECCERPGFRTLVAGDGAEALTRLRSAKTPVALALADQVMPGLDGRALLRAVRESERLHGLPVVLVSAAQLQPPADFPAHIRFDECTMKPLSEGRLAQTLERLLDLDWTYEDPPAATAPATTPTPSACPAGEFGRLREMVSLGQLSGIEQWAQAVTDRYPPDRQFFEEIVRCCTRVDLAGLNRIAWYRGAS